jgi:hypothetical protein
MRGVYNYMRQIGFRRALPLVFTLIHLSLVWFSPGRQPHAASMVFGNSGYRSVTSQEDNSVSVELFEPPSLKPVQKIALILELPAMFVATLIGAVLFPLNETAWLFTSIPFVPLVWYVIGRWLDGLLGDRINTAPRAKRRIAIVRPVLNLARGKHFKIVEAAADVALPECRAIVARPFVGADVVFRDGEFSQCNGSQSFQWIFARKFRVLSRILAGSPFEFSTRFCFEAVG